MKKNIVCNFEQNILIWDGVYKNLILMFVSSLYECFNNQIILFEKHIFSYFMLVFFFSFFFFFFYHNKLTDNFKNSKEV
jgi:hypothetical protein